MSKSKSDETVEALEADMIAAAILEQANPVIQSLYEQFGPVCEQAVLIGMLAYIGRTLATHPRIREGDRDDQLDSAIDMIHLAYERYRRR